MKNQTTTALLLALGFASMDARGDEPSDKGEKPGADPAHEVSAGKKLDGATKLQGFWRVAALEAGGQQAPAESFKGARLLIKGDQISLSGEAADLREYRLDETATPKQIDIADDSGNQSTKGIYEIDGDTLRLCFSQSAELDRPKEFDTQGTRYLCFTANRTDVENIQGSWKLVALDAEGQPGPAEIVAALKLVFENDTLTFTPGEPGFSKYKYELYPTAKPSSITLTGLEGSQKGKVTKGIYKLDGDRLKISIGHSERPTDFDAKAGSMRYSLERE